MKTALYLSETVVSNFFLIVIKIEMLPCRSAFQNIVRQSIGAAVIKVSILPVIQATTSHQAITI